MNLSHFINFEFQIGTDIADQSQSLKDFEISSLICVSLHSVHFVGTLF
jgi:hypothetical protein